MDTPESAVAGYLEDSPPRVAPSAAGDAYLEAAVAQHGIPALVDVAVRAADGLAAGTADVNAARLALLFARDAASPWARPAWDVLAARFRAALPASGLFEALERCLRAPVFATRRLAVHTFGKLHFPETVRPLEEALAARRDADPFLVPELVSEIGWIAADPDIRWPLVRQLKASPAELTRWAAVAVLSHHASTDQPAPLLELAEALQRDPSPFVRAEATHVAARVAFDARPRAATDVDRKTVRAAARQERKRIEALRPQVTLEELRARFTEGRDDYAVDEVLAYLAQVPSPPQR